MKPKYTVYTSPATVKALLLRTVSGLEKYAPLGGNAIFLSLSSDGAHPGG